MPPLSVDDLSFFDSHTSPGNQKTVNRDIEERKKPQDHSVLALESQPHHYVKTGGDDNDDDDFGDFEEYQETRPALVPQPAIEGHNHIKLSDRDDWQSRDEPQNSIQSRINELSEGPTKTNPIRFGQHMTTVKGQHTVTKTSEKQWNELLSTTPGPSPVDKSGGKPAKQSTAGPVHQPIKPVTKRPAKHNTPGIDQTTSTHSSSNTLVPDLEWEPFDSDKEDEGGNGDSNTTTPDPSYSVSKDAIELLQIAQKQSLPLVETLLASLAPLSYTLRKRVLAHAKTKAFIKGYLEIVHIVARIMAGRYRRAKSGSFPQKAADREARLISAVWDEEYVKRVRTILAPSQTVPELNSKIVLELNTKDEKCMVCGLCKTEFVRGHPKPRWGAAHGHKSCIAWYNSL